MSAGAPRWWGWHQLDSSWARRLVGQAGIGAGDLVLDVGAGTGALTAPLLDAGARVVAIELHPGRAAELRRRFAGRPVRVVQADAADLRLPAQPFHVVANPPFAVTTALLRRLLSPHSRLVRADLVVPRHVAGRWQGGRGPGAGRWSGSYGVRVATHLPPSAFHPPPPCSAAVLVVTSHFRQQGTRRSG